MQYATHIDVIMAMQHSKTVIFLHGISIIPSQIRLHTTFLLTFTHITLSQD